MITSYDIIKDIEKCENFKITYNPNKSELDYIKICECYYIRIVNDIDKWKLSINKKITDGIYTYPIENLEHGLDLYSEICLQRENNLPLDISKIDTSDLNEYLPLFFCVHVVNHYRTEIRKELENHYQVPN